MENIFSNAIFGKMYTTNDGRPAVFLGWSQFMDFAYLYVKEEGMQTYGELSYYLNGECVNKNSNLNIKEEL